MIFLPIVERELRSASRSRGVYWSRFAAALISLVVAGFTMAATYRQPTAQTGQAMFITMSWLGLLVCLFSGLWLTADSLSEEKREGTLGLLFLTDLRGYDVVIGKLAATSVNAILCLVAIVPVMALTLLLGGITLAEVGRTALALLTALLFSLSCGLFSSSVCRSSRRALVFTIALLLLANAILPVIGAVFEEYDKLRRFAFACYLPSAGCALTYANSSMYAVSWKGYWLSIAIGQAVSCLLLAVACLVVPKSWQDRARMVSEKGWRGKWRRLWFGGRKWCTRFRIKMLRKNPFFWLTARERWRPGLVWLMLAVAAALWLWGWYEDRRNWLQTENYVTTLLTLGVLLKIWMASEAARRLGLERRSGALELLLTTPLTEKRIVFGQLRTMVRMFLGPLIFLLLLIALFAVLDVRKDKQNDLAKYFLYGFVLLLDVVTIAALGMWLSLRMAHPHRAMLLTCLLVLSLPWAIYWMLSLGIVLILELTGSGMPISDDTGYYAALVLWLLTCLVLQGALLVWAGLRLVWHFRAVAATPVGRRPIYRLGSPLTPPANRLSSP